MYNIPRLQFQTEPAINTDGLQMVQWAKAAAFPHPGRALREERRCNSAAEPGIIDCDAAAEVGGARRHLAKSPQYRDVPARCSSHPLKSLDV